MWPSTTRRRWLSATASSTHRSSRRPAPRSGAACSPAVTLRGRTRSRCSASGASKDGLPSSRPSYGSWTRTLVREPGGRGSPHCTPSWAWSTTRVARCGGSSATVSARCGRRSGSPRSSTSPMRVPRWATRRPPKPCTPELAAYSGSNVMIGHLVACYGAMDRYLGMTAAVLGDWERAEEHFHAALALNTRLGARTWLAHTAYDYARMLLARNAGDDRSHAQGQLGLALGLAQTIGLPGLARRASELGADVEPAQTLPDGLSGREVEILVELARGRSNREIGRVLHISEHTAANHIRSILRKTRCANRTEAAAYALRRGLVPE